MPGPDGKPLHINGVLTLGENIADAGGLSASFAAWKEREAAHPSQLLPGLLHFSKEQLFFMSYGNWWCGKTRNEEQIRRLYSDPHSPNFARILVSALCNHRDSPANLPHRGLWLTPGSSDIASVARKDSRLVKCGRKKCPFGQGPALLQFCLFWCHKIFQFSQSIRDRKASSILDLLNLK